MGGTKRLIEAESEAIQTLDELHRAIDEIVKRSDRSNKYIPEIQKYLDEFSSYANNLTPDNSDIALLEDIQTRLSPSIGIIDKAAVVTDDNFLATYKLFKSLYNDYVLTLTKFRIQTSADVIEEKYKKQIIDLSEELDKSRASVIALEPEIIEVQSNLSKAGVKVTRLNDLITEKTFDETTEILSRKFFEKQNELIKERKWYLRPAIAISVMLGLTYITFFIYQFFNGETNNPIKYENHLMLITVCSPIIFLTVWMFFQANRLTRLAEIYSYKSSLGCTIKEAIDFVEKTENGSNAEYTVVNNSKEKFNKQTLQILETLLYKLYESPISHKEDKNQTLKSLSEVTALLGEVKGLVDSIKSTKVEDNGK